MQSNEWAAERVEPRERAVPQCGAILVKVAHQVMGKLWAKSTLSR